MTLEEFIKQQVRNHASYVSSYTPTLFKDKWVRQNREFSEEQMDKLIASHLKTTTSHILRAISKNNE